jgi:hypothetical protein
MSPLQNCLEDLYLEVFPVPGIEECLLDWRQDILWQLAQSKKIG